MSDTLPTDRKLKLNSNLKTIFVTSNEVLVKHGTRSAFSKIFSDHANTNIIGPLISQFEKPNSLDNSLESGAFPQDLHEEVISTVSMLVDEGVLVNADEGLVQSYYRAMRGVPDTLAEKHIGIIGSGQVGARVARHLAQLGAARLTLLDDTPMPQDEAGLRLVGFEGAIDKTQPSLARGLASGLKEAGDTIVSVLSDDRIDDDLCVELFNNCDFVIVAFDEYRLAHLHMINQHALDADKPWVSLYVDGSEAVVGPIFVPGETCCFNEFFNQGLAASGMLKKEVMTHLDALESAGTSSFGSVLPPYADIVAGQLSSAVADFLITERSFLVSRAIRHDFERLSVDYEDIRRLPRCPACRPFRPFRHVFL